MNKARVWVFRGLVAIVAGLMATSFILPWWSIMINQLGEDVVMIYPYGLRIDVEAIGEFISYLEGAEMPVWFAPAMWTYLGLCIALLLLILFVKEKTFNLGKFRFSLPKVIIGGVGLSYIVIVVLAVVVAAIRTGDFLGTHLIGYSYISLGEPAVSGANARLLFGYWLACAVGPLLIILALFRNKIIGKPKLIT